GSGVYIGDGWVLTAAHVVDGTDFAGANVSNWTFELGGTDYDSDEVYINPDWSGNLAAGNDIALVKLTEDVVGVEPAVLYGLSDESGMTGTVVGYGQTGTGLTGSVIGAGTLRAGENTIDAVGPLFLPGGGLFAEPIMLIDFDDPGDPAASSLGDDDPLPLEYLSAPGDSGGGLFVDVDGVTYLAGVTSFGLALDGTVDSDYGDVAGFIRVSQYAEWIEDITGIAAFAGVTEDGGSSESTDASSAQPEPSALMLACVALTFSGSFTSRRRSRVI
ncbi:MAG: trypsin-like serine protease, partial [Pirellulales bacterium]|nr:trypsin-like serine protease [Pirellulales bacterium]